MDLLLISPISYEWNICVGLESHFCKDCLFSDDHCIFEKDSTNHTDLQSASWAQEQIASRSGFLAVDSPSEED